MVDFTSWVCVSLHYHAVDKVSVLFLILEIIFSLAFSWMWYSVQGISINFSLIRDFLSLTLLEYMGRKPLCLYHTLKTILCLD